MKYSPYIFFQKLNVFIISLLLIYTFYIILTPIALIGRVFRGDTLGLKNHKKSTFRDYNTIINKEFFKKPW